MIPTSDSNRVEYIIKNMAQQGQLSTLMVGGTGRGKTSTGQLFLKSLGREKYTTKRMCISMCTMPSNFRKFIESNIEKK